LLASALDAKPIGGEHGPTILTLMRDHIAGRIPLIAAGHIRTPEQAEQAIAAGLSPVAIGQGLVMNSDWAAFARDNASGAVALELAASDVARLAIPQSYGP
jgi:2,4-dienoyl-CoA reductase-like NADH-dependent reductase (Old Yellow Enzyme family)